MEQWTIFSTPKILHEEKHRIARWKKGLKPTETFTIHVKKKREKTIASIGPAESRFKLIFVYFIDWQYFSSDVYDKIVNGLSDQDENKMEEIKIKVEKEENIRPNWAEQQEDQHHHVIVTYSNNDYIVNRNDDDMNR